MSLLFGRVFRVQGLGFMVLGFKAGVQGFGLRA